MVMGAVARVNPSALEGNLKISRKTSVTSELILLPLAAISYIQYAETGHFLSYLRK
jgi:hypothetical protein